MTKGSQRSGAASATPVQSLAAEARAFAVAGHQDAARAAYDELVGILQRRATRLALHYLRDVEEADEAVQDAFVKAYVHLASYKDQLSFEAWFTKILVNGCLDRLKQRRRRLKWFEATDPADPRTEPAAVEPSPLDAIMSREWRQSLDDAIHRLPDRQRTVVLLTHLDGRTPREVSAITGLNENTVRVHLFRAVRRLRGWLLPAEDAHEKEA